MSQHLVTLEIEGGFARLRMRRGEARNAIDRALAEALHEAISDCAGRVDVRVVLLSAEGSAFSVGGDLAHLHQALDRLPSELEAMISTYHAALAQLASMPAPVVCAVQGGVGGGGLGLIWCSDVVIAADNVKLASGFPRLGFSGDGGSSWALTRLVGARRAWEFLAGGRVLSAREAAEWGLVSAVVPSDQLQTAAESAASRLAVGPTRAYTELRALIRRGLSSELTEQLDAERQAMIRLSRSDDVLEGIDAFIQRREPRFTGS